MGFFLIMASFLCTFFHKSLFAGSWAFQVGINESLSWFWWEMLEGSGQLQEPLRVRVSSSSTFFFLQFVPITYPGGGTGDTVFICASGWRILYPLGLMEWFPVRCYFVRARFSFPVDTPLRIANVVNYPCSTRIPIRCLHR